MKGNCRRAQRSSSKAPSRSWMSAGRTTTLNRRPIVSTRMWRLRPLTFLPRRNPKDRAKPPFLRSFGALAVDDGRCRARLSAFRLARLDIERVMDALQRSVPVPQVEIVVNRALRRQILGQRLPLAAGPQHVEDGVQTPRAHSPNACDRRAGPAGSSARSAPIPHRSDRSGNAGQTVWPRGGVQASTSGAPMRIRLPTRNHKRFIRLNIFRIGSEWESAIDPGLALAA